MGSTERLHLRWNDFESNIKHGFSELRADEEFFDVTLAVGGKQIKAHKVILSACSPFFRSLLKSVSHAHPLLYLRGIKSSHLEALLCFMYNGEVNVVQEELSSLLAVAEELQIRGLTQNNPPPPPPTDVNDSPPPNKRVRLQGGLKNPPEQITLDDDEVLPVDTKEEVEQGEPKFLPPNNETSGSEEHSQYQNEDFQEEKVFEEEYIQDSDETSAYGENISALQGSSAQSLQHDDNNKDNRFFHLNETIKRHIKKLEDGSFICIVCKKSSQFISNIKKHVESKHIVTDGFRCETCNLVCKTRATLRSHRLHKHPPGPVYVPTNFEASST